MPQLFTVRWPLFARLEVILFFPFALRLAGEAEPVRTYVDHGLVPALAPVFDQMGMSDNAIYWLAVTAVVIVPYIFVLLVADRVLTVRKGYVLLSAIAIGAWTGTALQLSWLLMKLVPESVLTGTDWLSFDQEAALAVGGLALLLHLRPLWIGLRDDGDVAMRLLDGDYDHALRRGHLNQSPHTQDVYYRQTAAFREWGHPQEQLGGLRSGPRENSAVKALYAVTWFGVILGVGTAYLNWNGIIDLSGKKKVEPPPIVAASPLVTGPNAKSAAPAPMPVVQSAPAMPMVNSHVVAAAPMPMVQRPTEISASVQSTSAISGPNEAVAERGTDGSFAFDAVMNGGTHVRMLFDTGASVVGLRAEDATRIGVPMAKLNYSTKIKTANGTADVAPVMIGTMMIGNITLRNVPGFVAKQGMLQENLLGQTFLERLAGFNVEKNLLVLKGR
jgi:clan AA aspartic protease (TIGR02281 family)